MSSKNDWVGVPALVAMLHVGERVHLSEHRPDDSWLHAVATELRKAETRSGRWGRDLYAAIEVVNRRRYARHEECYGIAALTPWAKPEELRSLGDHASESQQAKERALRWFGRAVGYDGFERGR